MWHASLVASIMPWDICPACSVAHVQQSCMSTNTVCMICREHSPAYDYKMICREHAYGPAYDLDDLSRAHIWPCIRSWWSVASTHVTLRTIICTWPWTNMQVHTQAGLAFGCFSCANAEQFLWRSHCTSQIHHTCIEFWRYRRVLQSVTIICTCVL